MSSPLLESPDVISRRKEFRRETARRDLLSPLAEASPRSQVPSPKLGAAIVSDDIRVQPESQNSEPISVEETHDTAPADAKRLLEEARVQAWLAGKSPSRRNRDIFRAVVVEKRSQRDVAEEFGITQPRVHQILRQVGSWLSHVVAERDQAREPPEQLQLAENVTRMQYDHLYATALELLRESRQKEEPKVGFLNAAIRAVTDKAKFEGLVGLPARRAAAEAASYNPLSPDGGDQEGDEEGEDEVTAEYRVKYAQYPARFGANFDERAAYYVTQTGAVFGADVIEEEGDEPEDWVDWMYDMDLLAAQAAVETERRLAGSGAAGAEPLSPEQRSAVQRQCLIEALMREGKMVRSDAESLVEKIYDVPSSRCVWDLRFQAQQMAQASTAAP